MNKLRQLLLVAAAIGFGDSGKSLAAPEPLAKLEIGVSESLLPGIPDWMRGVVADPFLKLIKEHTGYIGHASYLPDGLAVGKELDEGKLHFGIQYGHEYGWAKAKHPKLKLLAVATPIQPCQAFVLVLADSKAATIADLAKENITLPPVQRPYGVMLLTKLMQEHLKGADFRKTVIADTAVDAIFDVIEGRSGCTVVDAVTLKFFETAYPGPFKNVKILVKSEVFPSPCIALKTDTIEPKQLEKIKTTLLKADKLPGGEALLRVWRSKAFEEPTEAYYKACQEIAEKYSPPAAKK